jgi:hypothetical protein
MPHSIPMVDNLGWLPTTHRDGVRTIFGYARVVYIKTPTKKDEPPAFDEQFLSVFPGPIVDVELQTSERVTTLDRLQQCERDQQVVLIPPEGARVIRVPLVVACAEHVAASAVGDLIKEVEDVLEQMAGAPSRLQRTRTLVEQLLASHNIEQHLAAVEFAYDGLPLYARRFLGSMDSKGRPLGRLLQASSAAERAAALNELREDWSR